jgi:methylamine dehydrogenase heavy chain
VKRARNLLAIGSALACWATVASAELAPEKLTVAALAPANPHRIYLTDVTLGHVIDGRVHVIDGDDFSYLGMISTGLFGITALSPDSSEMYVATTYYTKRNRGDRFDQFEAYDTATLALKSEVQIPAKHAQTLPYKGTLSASVDGRWVFIQNATPASSVTVVDRKAEKVTAEIPTPGCWIILPAHSTPNRFSTLCGDGTVVTVTLNDTGAATGQERSERLFDAEKDPLFVQAERIGDQYYFVSFEGNVHVMNLGGEVATLETTWSLLDDADRAARWKPGGYQALALHAPTRRLYVTMHDEGRDGSHKRPAKEIWVFDLDARKRIQRAPGANAIAITLTKEATPLLYAYDGVGARFVRYQTAPELKASGESEPLGEFAGLIETH